MKSKIQYDCSCETPRAILIAIQRWLLYWFFWHFEVLISHSNLEQTIYQYLFPNHVHLAFESMQTELIFYISIFGHRKSIPVDLLGEIWCRSLNFPLIRTVWGNIIPCSSHFQPWRVFCNPKNISHSTHLFPISPHIPTEEALKFLLSPLFSL